MSNHTKREVIDVTSFSSPGIAKEFFAMPLQEEQEPVKPFFTITTNRLTGVGTVIADSKGNQVKGIKSATIELAVDRVNTAVLTLVGVATVVHAQVEFRVVHPATGKLTEVSEITFTDGSHWTASGSDDTKTT